MKKNFRKIPEYISAKIDFIAENELMIIAVSSFSKKDLEENALSKLGVKFEGEALNIPQTQFPASTNGKYSKKNREGYTIIRKDLPKISKIIDCGTRYPFGNTELSSYNLSYERMVYQREFIPPRNLNISIELLDIFESKYIFKVGVNMFLSKETTNFENELLYGLNLLQENFGKVDIYSVNATRQEFLKTQNVAWELFPNGERDENLEKILSGVSRLTEQDKQNIKDKYDFLVELNPESIIIGSGGMARYFGAKFANNLVVFENLDYGHAIYVMYEDWEILSRLSRTELLSLDNKNFDRIKHTENWKTKVLQLVSRKLKNRNIAA